MQAINNIIKWSFITGGMAGMAILTGIFAVWLGIEVLVTISSANI